METNKYLIPIIASAEGSHYVVKVDEEKYAYFSYSEDFYPNYTFKEYYEAYNNIIQFGDNLYAVLDNIPYVAKSNLTEEYFLLPENLIYTITPQDLYSSIINDLNTTKDLLNNITQEKELLILENTNIKEENVNLTNTLNKYKGFERINEVKASCPHNIFVDIFRISADGEYLELDVSCHPDYEFTSFILADYEHDKNNNKIWNLSLDIDSDSNRQMFRIKLSDLNGPSMYYGNISAKLRETEENDYIDVIDLEESIMLACSDVTNVYYYLLKELQSVANPCDPCNSKLSTELQRVFVILYAHLEAMRLERWTEAEMFYTLIKNNFSNCKSSYELKPSKSCNCYGKI